MKSLKYSPNYIEKVEIWSFLKFTVLGKILIFLFTDKGTVVLPLRFDFTFKT